MSKRETRVSPKPAAQNSRCTEKIEQLSLLSQPTISLKYIYFPGKRKDSNRRKPARAKEDFELELDLPLPLSLSLSLPFLPPQNGQSKQLQQQQQQAQSRFLHLHCFFFQQEVFQIQEGRRRRSSFFSCCCCWGGGGFERLDRRSHLP